MRARRLQIHNFRSVLDAHIEVSPYGLLVGPNGAGKSNVLASIRAFYDDIKFSTGRDFPKMPTADQETWVEIEFGLREDEAKAIKSVYLGADGCSFRVRRYLQTQENGADNKSKEGGLFGYENGVLSSSRFYGAKNVQSGKVGRIVYIPAVTKLDDHTKLSGPSSLRDLVNHVLKGQLEKSREFTALQTAFSDFRSALRDGTGAPLADIEGKVTDEIEDWGHSFRLDVRSIAADELLKSLVSPKIIDGDLDAELDPSQFGHGFQRHLVYSLMMLAAQHSDIAKQKAAKKEFDPDLFWVLYEEPEAFLHPPQAEVLNVGLRSFSLLPDHQVTVTTHSPVFASKNLGDITSLIRLARRDGATQVGQLDQASLDALFASNQSLLATLGETSPALDAEIEGLRYALWLDPSRASALFAERVLLVEGPTERAVIGYLLDRGLLKTPKGGLAVIDTLGKYNTHRFMRLLSGLGIHHSVLHDADGGKDSDKHKVLNAAIQDSRSPYTDGIQTFETHLEDFLGLVTTGDRNLKPILLLKAIAEEQLAPGRVQALLDLLQPLATPPR